MKLSTSENSLSLNSREDILKLNPDSIYGVYSLKEENEKGYELEYLENVMICYPNQYENLEGKDAIDPNITILDLGELRKGKIKVLHGNKNIDIKNPILLSNGVIEYIEAKYIDPNTKKIKTKKHIITTLRDGGAADSLQRTTIAGRNSTGNIFEDLREEHIGEAPFLGKDNNGEYILCVVCNSEEKIKFLEEGIKKFLREKYLQPVQNIKNSTELSKYNNTKKLFERSFPGIKYDDLGDILKEVLKNKRYEKYETKDGNIEGLSNDIKNIKMGDKQGDFFVYHDKSNNTIEYRKVLQITKLPENFIPISTRPGRLYLESENQYPRSPRVSNANSIHKLVPTVKYLCEKSLEE